MRVPLQFVGAAYSVRSSNVNAQRCVNWYLEVGPDGKTPAALYPTPGMTEIEDTSELGFRGGLVYNGVAYLVCGDQLFSFNGTTATSLGSLVTTSGRVGMATDGTYIGIVDGANGYRLTISGSTFAQVTDVDFPGGDTVCWINGYFVVNEPDSGRMWSSANFSSWIALDFATAEHSPDNAVAVATDHGELISFNETTTEFWYYDAGTNFPFRRVEGRTLERGCGAAHSVAKVDNTVFWLGDDGCVYRYDGNGPQRISTHAVEFSIQGYSAIDDAFAMVEEWDGHKFYILSFPTGGETWAYDVATGLWHQRASFSGGAFTRWRAGVIFKLGRAQYAGDHASGKILELDLEVYTEDGDTIKRLRTTQYVNEAQYMLFHQRLEVLCESGVGNAAVTDPVFMLRFSDDGGHTWGNIVNARMGEVGNYGARAIWNRLGAARQRIYELSVTDAVKPILLGATLDADKGWH